MINKTRGSDPQPFSGLTPEVVLDAAAAFGLAPDGRLFALNSYENRVYQLGAGDTQLVLKFYRPQRWSDAQIAEEHQFTAELAAAELAVATPLVIGGETLFRYREFRFAAFPWMRGRAPELDAPEARQIFGRSLARIHQIGALRTFQVRPRIDVQRLGWDARVQVLSSELLPEALRERYSTVSGALLERVSEAFAAAAGTREIRLHGDCHLGNLLWNEHGPVFVDLDDCATGVRVQDLWMMLAGSPPNSSASGASCWPVTGSSRISISANCSSSSRCAAYACCTMLPGWRTAGATRPSRAPFPGSPSRATGRATSMICWSRSPPSMSPRSCSCEGQCRSRTCAGARRRAIVATGLGNARTAMRMFTRRGGFTSNLGPALAASVMLLGCSSPETPGVAGGAAKPGTAPRKPQPGDVVSPNMVSAVSSARTGPASVQVKFELRERPDVAQPLDIDLVILPGSATVDRLYGRDHEVDGLQLTEERRSPQATVPGTAFPSDTASRSCRRGMAYSP